MGELRKSSTSRSSSKKKKDVKTVGTGITKDRATKSKSSKRLSERFHGMEDSTPRVSHLRKTISESKVSKAKSIPSLASDDSNGNNGSKRTFVDAASAVTFQLSSAFNKLADITSEFLYPPDEKPGLVDISTDTMPSTPQSIRLQLETTFSTITTDLEGGKLESSFNKEIDNSIVDKESLITPPRKAERPRHKGFSEEKKMESPQQSFHDLSTPDRSSFDSHSNLPPPPQLLEGRVHAKHSASQQLHRPVPVPGGSPIGTAFETPKRVYPKREDEYAYMRTTPIARMRHLEAQKAASIQDVTPNHSKSEEELKKEKQRKWRRRIKMAETKREKERRELYDDTTTAVGTSATNAAGPCKDGLGAAFMESTTSPILLFQQLIRTRCGVLEDSLSFDSGDDESQSGVSQDSEEFVTTEDEEESVDGTTDRNRSLETSMFTDSLASESRSLFNTPEQRTGPLPATPSTMNEQPLLNISDDSGNPLLKQETNTSRVELNDKNFIKTFILVRRILTQLPEYRQPSSHCLCFVYFTRNRPKMAYRYYGIKKNQRPTRLVAHPPSCAFWHLGRKGQVEHSKDLAYFWSCPTALMAIA